jgi:phosphate uptake regulator
MDNRKIIGFGKSTFSITLPKKWVLKNNLKKGDVVSIMELPRGKLEVVPSSRKEKPKVKRISIDINKRPIKEVQREFIAAYIKGYSVIDLVGNHEGKVSEIRRRLHELIAVEIMEVAANRITANVFFDTSTTSLSNLISRIEIITRNILEEGQSILTSKRRMGVKYKELIEKKREVDRQSLFAIRIIVTALTDPIFASRIETDTLKLSFIWHLIEYVEKISDYMLNIAYYMTSTDLMEKLGEEGKKELYDIFTLIQSNYTLAMKAYNKSSVSLANDVFSNHTKNDRELYDFLYRYKGRWLPIVTGYLRRTSSKSRDIAKITININTS